MLKYSSLTCQSKVFSSQVIALSSKASCKKKVLQIESYNCILIFIDWYFFILYLFILLLLQIMVSLQNGNDSMYHLRRCWNYYSLCWYKFDTVLRTQSVAEEIQKSHRNSRPTIWNNYDGLSCFETKKLSVILVCNFYFD